MENLVNLGFIRAGIKSQDENDWNKAASEVHGVRGNVIAKPKI